MVAQPSNRNGIVENTLQQVGNMSLEDGIKGARVLGGFTQVGQFVDPLLAAAEGECAAQREYKKLAAKFTAEEIRRSRPLRRQVGDLATRWQGNAAEAACSAGGAIAGAAATTALWTATMGPVGMIGSLALGAAGCMGGGMVFDKLYCTVKPPLAQDTAAIVSLVDDAVSQGVEIPPEVMSMLAVSMLDRAKGKRAEDRLERHGTRDFFTAIQQGLSTNSIHKFRPLIKEFENDVCGIVHLPANPKRPGQPIGEQMAELVNAGVVKAKDFVVNPDKIFRAYQRYMLTRAEQPEAPETPVALATPSQARDQAMVRSNG